MSRVLVGSVEKAAYVLCIAYLLRDRDVKLRVYPAASAILIMPFVLLIVGRVPAELAFMSQFMVCLSAAYLGFMPSGILRLLRFSQQWKAAEIYHAAPISGPWPFHRGAQAAVMTAMAGPTVLLVLCVVFLNGLRGLPMLLPGLISLPVYACLDGFIDDGVLLSRPIEEMQAMTRGCIVMAVSFLAFFVAVAAFAAWMLHVYICFLILQTGFSVAVCILMDRRLKRARWRSLE
jgi:hypothetical protein